MSFWNWFIGEAGAGWIFGFSGLLFSLYMWRNRERPPKVIVQEIQALRLLDIHKAQGERIQVTYTNKLTGNSKIGSLEQRTFVIYNAGTKDISDSIELQLQICPAASVSSLPFIDIEFDPRWQPVPSVLQTVLGEEYKLDIVLPYLNSYSGHGHFITGYLVSEHPISVTLGKGMGRGWSVQLVSLHDIRNRQKQVRKLFQVIEMTFLAGIFILLAGMLFQISIETGDPFISVMALLDPTPARVDAVLKEQKILLESGFMGFTMLILLVVLIGVAVKPFILTFLSNRIVNFLLGCQPLKNLYLNGK